MVLLHAKRSLRWMGTTALLLTLAASASAGDLKIKIPKKTKPTPVQKLNQDGVRALDKHDYKKAKSSFTRLTCSIPMILSH